MLEYLTSPTGSYVLCAILGGAVGMIELVSRYKDDPMAAVQCIAAIVYTLINVFASVVALLIIRSFDSISLGTPGAVETAITEILVAGFGAMAFLRTSIFNVSIGSDKVSVGPAALLDVVLDASDRAVDRRRAQARGGSLKGMGWENVSFNKSQSALPAYCFALMQNVSRKEQHAVGEHVKVLKASTLLTPQQKLRLMVLALMNIVGEDVIKEAKNGLGAEIEGDDEEDTKKAISKMEDAVKDFNKEGDQAS